MLKELAQNGLAANRGADWGPGPRDAGLPDLRRHENRGTSSVFPGRGTGPRKAECHTPDVYAGEESDGAAVPMKPPNQEAQASAERVEGRARTKENTGRAHPPPAQDGRGVSQGLVGVRKAGSVL